MDKQELLMEFKEKLIPEVSTAIFENPELKKLFEEHATLIATKAKPKEDVKFAQTAKFFRALSRKDKKELGEVYKEELPKYQKLWNVKTGVSPLMSEGDAEQGGNLVPVEYTAELQRLPCIYGLARSDCRIWPMKSKSRTIPTVSQMPTTYWIGENVAKTPSKPKFGLITLTAVKQIALIVFTEELLADATPPLIQILLELTKEQMSRGEDLALWTGNGGAGIVGILADPNVHQEVMDNNRQSFTQVHPDDCLKLITAVNCNSEEGGAFYMHKTIWEIIRTYKSTTGSYVWQDPNKPDKKTIWGYPVKLSPVMRSITADAINTPFIIFGNLKRSVAFGDRQALTVKLLTEATIMGTNLAEYDLQALRFVERVDIEVVLPGGISVLYTAP